MVESERMFEALGLSRDQELVYEALLSRPGSSASQLRTDTRLPSRSVGEALTALESLGFLSQIRGRPAKYLPAPPTHAVAALIATRRLEMDTLLARAAELEEQHATVTREEPAEITSIVIGMRAVALRWIQELQQCETEVRILVDPPYFAAPEGSTDIQRLMVQIPGRTIVSHAALEDRATFQRPAHHPDDEVRVLPTLPTKLALLDRRVALLPLLDRIGTPTGAIIVRPGPILDALSALFENLWDIAAPIPERLDLPIAKPGRVSDDDLIRLLGSGLKDVTIGKTLGVSRATVERRIAALMATLGATTRFQAGLLLGSRNGVTFERPQ